MIYLNYRDNRPIYSQIVDNIREQILAGALQENDKLPSVRELAAQLAINPNTIQRAYRELETQGWVATVQGKGCFVCPIPKPVNGGQQALLENFDRTVQALLEMGVSREELLQRLKEGEKDHA